MLKVAVVAPDVAVIGVAPPAVPVGTVTLVLMYPAAVAVATTLAVPSVTVTSPLAGNPPPVTATAFAGRGADWVRGEPGCQGHVRKNLWGGGGRPGDAQLGGLGIGLATDGGG